MKSSRTCLQQRPVGDMFASLSLLSKRKNIGPLFVMVGLLSISHTAASADAPVPQVKIAAVQAWQQGMSQSMYCVVNTPFVYQAASHSEAELLHILPRGSRVKKGQLIAEQDDFYLKQRLGQLAIEQQLANAELAHAQSEQQRLLVLDRKKLVANAQLNQATLVLTTAQLKLKSLSNEKQTLERRIARLQHRAPFDAQVLSVSGEPGQQLSLGQTVFQLLPVKQKQLECKLPLALAKELNLSNTDGAGVQYRLKSQVKGSAELEQTDLGGKPGKLSLRQLSQDVDIDTQNLSVYFDYQAGAGEEQELLVGQRVQVEIQQQYNDITRVPYDAVTLDGSSYQLWLLNKDNTVSKINPKVISTTKDFFIVRSPLRAGDQVIVRGQKRLKEQQQVHNVGERT